uniref:NADH-ubiquinone oxidoreductase chain 6 n=1 Tax=Glyptotermes sp. 6 AB-2022a TaxID=2942729 RepID=A0A8X8M1Y2_9NEOP|nr:NADH dehydrogenase subunit 6 [Glyptotermes sp. 6 AB-2022a]URX52978.1 NADH dehydrogenase subunit 6 [Glyptotermes sp. 6 AB-2022a]URX52991.1 NADH dehydrogenase subunit 6 [Glyptotermes sp. 6 AB-2022a]
MKKLMMMSILSSTMFTQMKHPLAMGMMLLMQTLITCLISGSMHKSFWFQYILFMVFVGGMLVLFIYVTSLASNEMFSLSTKMIAVLVMMTPGMMMIENYMNMSSKEIMSYETVMTEEIITMTSKLYNQPNGTMTILLALYLLLTLIVVVKITNISKGPLRQNK